MKKTLHSAESRKIRTWLKNQRIAQGLTMRQLAKKLNSSHSLIGKIEQGERRLDIVEYVNYCKALDINPTIGVEIILNMANRLTANNEAI